MNAFCKDRDILASEPIVYLSDSFPGRRPKSGTDGAISSTTFTSAAGGLSGGAISAGMILCVYETIPSEGDVLEIISIDSATTMTVSILRASEADDPAPPRARTGLKFFVKTFDIRINEISATLSEALRLTAEAEGVASAEFADSEQLKMAAVCGVLTRIFITRADNAKPDDANWTKAKYYADEFNRRRTQLRLAVDADGDGVAEKTRTLSNVTLRRI